MKKLLFITLAMFAVGFTSCKKDHTCECVDDETGEVLVTRTINNTKKLEKTECETSNLAGFGITCKIK